MSRGYFAIGIEHTKDAKNVGVLWRSANLYGAAFVFTVGARYRPEASDTMNTPLHVPLFHFDTIADLHEHLPDGCPLVGVELTDDSIALANYTHPERVCYLLGAEDKGLSDEALSMVRQTVQIETPKPWSMNVAVAGSVVLHDRFVSRKVRP